MPRIRSTQRAHYAHKSRGTVPLVAGTIKIRGRPIVLPKWWIDELRQKFEYQQKAGEETKVSLAKKLSDVASRPLPWDHKAVERFLKNKTTTFEMMWAFLKIYPSMVPPVFFAPTRQDAERMLDFLRRDDSNPDWRDRYLELEAEVLELEQEVSDQTDELTSSNGSEVEVREPGSRRPRSVD